MKAQDLMIGDWVRCGKRYMKVTQLAEDMDCDDIEPITLTPEILEKNGFIRDGESWWYQDCRIVLSTSKGVSLVCGWQKRFAFVHELQHALKLCGIEKNIII